jgi:hypothetical protein
LSLREKTISTPRNSSEKEILGCRPARHRLRSHTLLETFSAGEFLKGHLHAKSENRRLVPGGVNPVKF